jgi:hypothetical protein
MQHFQHSASSVNAAHADFGQGIYFWVKCINNTRHSGPHGHDKSGRHLDYFGLGINVSEVKGASLFVERPIGEVRKLNTGQIAGRKLIVDALVK